MLKSIQRAEMSIVYTSCSYFIIYTVNLKFKKKKQSMLTWKKIGVYNYTQQNSGRTKNDLSLNNPKIYYLKVIIMNLVLVRWNIWLKKSCTDKRKSIMMDE